MSFNCQSILFYLNLLFYIGEKTNKFVRELKSAVSSFMIMRSYLYLEKKTFISNTHR